MADYQDYSKRARKMVWGAPRSYLEIQRKRLEEKLLIEIPKLIVNAKTKLELIDECLRLYDEYPDATLEARAIKAQQEREAPNG